MKNLVLVAAAALIAVSGCKCGGPGSTGLKPDYTLNPQALSFEACPTVDNAGMAVADVFPDRKVVKLINNGKVAGQFKATFTGNDADAFRIEDGGSPEVVGSLGEFEVPILFSPKKKGDLKAELSISDEVEGTDDVKVTLTGTGSGLDPTPKLETKPFDKDLNKFDTGTCFTGGSCQQVYPDTLYKEASTLEIQFKNLGCPALKITSLEIIPYPGDTGNLAFFIETPSIPPTAASPVLLTTSDGRQQTVVKIRFAPEDDSTGDTQRRALLRLKTNDMSLRDFDNTPGNFDVLLQGAAIEPAIYATPSRCDYNDSLDNCGLASKMTGQAQFTIKNGGNSDVKIDSVVFKSNNSPTMSKDGRFAITNAIAGQTLTTTSPGLQINVTHSDMPLYVQDQIIVSASVAGQPAGSAGRVTLALSGGKKPCLSTTPAIDMTGQARLDFSNPSTELSAKPLKIKNGPAPMCGELIINAVSVDPNPFFSLIDPKIAAGTKVPPGGEVEATVQYKKPVSGGLQVGTLRIDTNDGDFAGPSYYVVQLYSQSPLDQLPVAVLKGCLPADTTCAAGKVQSMNVGLSMLGATKKLIMYGKDSYDPGNNSPMAISGYTFRLVSQPTNATNYSLVSNNMKVTTPSVDLNLDPSATGQYRVILTVHDDKNQASTAVELKVNVGP